MSNQPETTITPEIIALVVARLEALPPNVAISVGEERGLDMSDLIERVRACDEVGKQVIEMQLTYLRSLKDLSPTNNEVAHN